MTLRIRMKLGRPVSALAAFRALRSASTSSNGRHPARASRRRRTGGDVFAERDVGVALDRDVVVVIEHDQIAEPLVAREAARLTRDAFLHVTVGDEHPDRGVEDALARLRVRVEQAALAARRHRHPDRGGDALTERTGGRLDSQRVAMFGVARGPAAPLPVELQVVDRESVARQVELDIDGEAGMPARKHEPIASDPVGIGGVVPQKFLEEEVGRGRQAHGGTRVAVSGRLDRIHRQGADVVDGLPVEV